MRPIGTGVGAATLVATAGAEGAHPQLHLKHPLPLADVLPHAEGEGIEIRLEHPLPVHAAAGEIETIQLAVEQQKGLAPALQAGQEHLSAPCGHLAPQALQPQSRTLPDEGDQDQPEQPCRDHQPSMPG